MSASSVGPERSAPEHVVTAASGASTSFARVVACVDTSEFTRKILSHGLAVAKALDAPLTLLRVLEVGPNGPSDPVERKIRQREAQGRIVRLAQACARDGAHVDVEVIEGAAAEKIALWTHEHRSDLAVLGTHGEGGSMEWSLGSTARRVMERGTGSVLLVPSSVRSDDIHYRRLLVPVDGSCRAESVLPLAVRIAKAHGAELVLAHVVPVPELTETGPLDKEDIDLRERLAARNERVARDYLDRLRMRLAASGISTRVIIRRGDVRSNLSHLIANNADLVVLSAHGQAARADVPYGRVTAHLITHIAVPLLIVQRETRASTTRSVGLRDVDMRLSHHTER
ncbi:MAG: universal stress protein [Parvibaculum sp.]|uniref:universal stress protein n=1 Tax=Parvibaculum sp. TaxID=2024848 RepID=UPI00271A11AA|nr:universal stress protein [Parvibaculum sp.]MDO8840487.1 universal stress protein [Parvibaculum sp.]